MIAKLEKIDTNNVITSIAGTGPCNLNGGTYGGDGGLANQTELVDPFDVAVDNQGNILIGDEGGSRIVYANTGKIYTFDKFSFSSIAVNLQTNEVYIATFINNTIIKVNITNNQTTLIAGTGVAGFSPDGPITSTTMLNAPYSLRFIQGLKQLIFVETGTNLVRIIDLNSNTLSTLAGNGSTYLVQSGPVDVSTVKLYSPWSVSPNQNGTQFVVGEYNGINDNVNTNNTHPNRVYFIQTTSTSSTTSISTTTSNSCETYVMTVLLFYLILI